MKLSMLELFVVFVVAFVLIGPEKLPVYVKKGMLMLKEFKSYTSKLTEEVNESLVEPLQETAAPIREMTDEIMEPLEDVKKAVKDIL